MKNYQDTLRKILAEGKDREGRNGVTRAIFAHQLRFNLADGFPAVTTKKLAFNTMKAELLWFLEGSGDNNRLAELTGVAPEKTIWFKDGNAEAWKKKAKFPGDLGRIYGVQWRHWRRPDGTEVDQIARSVKILREDPHNRKNLVSAWNAGELEEMALEPCHVGFSFFVADGVVSMHMLQRSCDMFLGVPFNIASYALLLSMFAQVANLKPGELVITLIDAHIYEIHYDAVREQLKRVPKKLPTLWLNPAVKEIEDFKMDDIKLENYEHDSQIKAEMA